MVETRLAASPLAVEVLGAKGRRGEPRLYSSTYRRKTFVPAGGKTGCEGDLDYFRENEPVQAPFKCLRYGVGQGEQPSQAAREQDEFANGGSQRGRSNAARCVFVDPSSGECYQWIRHEEAAGGAKDL